MGVHTRNTEPIRNGYGLCRAAGTVYAGSSGDRRAQVKVDSMGEATVHIAGCAATTTCLQDARQNQDYQVTMQIDETTGSIISTGPNRSNGSQGNALSGFVAGDGSLAAVTTADLRHVTRCDELSKALLPTIIEKEYAVCPVWCPAQVRHVCQMTRFLDATIACFGCRGVPAPYTRQRPRAGLRFQRRRRPLLAERPSPRACMLRSSAYCSCSFRLAS